MKPDRPQLSIKLMNDRKLIAEPPVIKMAPFIGTFAVYREARSVLEEVDQVT